MNNKKILALFEVKIGDRWCPVRIAREFLNICAVLNSLPLLAKQQQTSLDDVRAKALYTEEALLAAEEAVIKYHHEQMDDPRR